MEHIGERIRTRRKMLNMSQADLAGKVGYDADNNKSTISKIETGVNDITRTKITVFANALDTTEAYLMGWTDNPELTREEVISNDNQNISFPQLHLKSKHALNYNGSDQLKQELATLMQDILDNVSNETKLQQIKMFLETYKK